MDRFGYAPKLDHMTPFSKFVTDVQYDWGALFTYPEAPPMCSPETP